MSKQNYGDVTYTDGCMYIYSRTLSTGTHTYYFYAYDSISTTSTSTVSSPSVSTTNSAPTLTSGSVSPTSGNTYTTFVYRVIYTDSNNNAPSYMRVYIDGTSYTMSKVNSSDLTYTDGCVYIYSRTLSTGTHNYYFYASDGTTTISTSTVSTPSVSTTNTAPVLSAGSVSPIIGSPSMSYYYYVTYTDSDNNAPYYIRVYIDGSYYSMSAMNSSDVTYTDGCNYYYVLSLSTGSHNYYFYAHDGNSITTTSTSIGPIVVNNAPQLTGGTVSPTSGVPSTTFTYSVTYSDTENTAPSYVRVYIDGTYYTMSKQVSGHTTITSTRAMGS
jgi:hypothetical protein